jgi:hypothetical protein
VQWFSLYVLHTFQFNPGSISGRFCCTLSSYETLEDLISKLYKKRLMASSLCVYSPMPQAAEKRAHLNKQTTWCQPLQYYPVLKCIFTSLVDTLSSFCNMFLSSDV